MQKRVGGLLLFLMLLQVSQMRELLKMPLLIEHYCQHRQLHPATTVFGFFKMHYLDKTVVDDDFAQDMELPFKTVDDYNQLIQLFFPPNSINLQPESLEFSPTYIIYHNPFIRCLMKHKVFQPPKLADLT